MSKLQNPYDMTPEQLAMVLSNIKVLEGWIESVKKYAFDTISGGTKVPGYKIDTGPRKRIWREGTQAAAIVALEKLGVSRDELFTKSELLTLPKVESLLKERLLMPRKKRNEPNPPSPLDPYTDRAQGTLQVMPLTGKDYDPESKIEDAIREFDS